MKEQLKRPGEEDRTKDGGGEELVVVRFSPRNRVNKTRSRSSAVPLSLSREADYCEGTIS